jgi:hypothetical protein
MHAQWLDGFNALNIHYAIAISRSQITSFSKMVNRLPKNILTLSSELAIA